MVKLSDTEEAEARVLSSLRLFFIELRRLGTNVSSAKEGFEQLRDLRGALYENLNQLQHEYLLLRGLNWLRSHGYGDRRLEWSWNPRQTGNATEPDLQGIDGTQIVVSAEATSSEKPQGSIDTRMHYTLAKLHQLVGRRFYFVQTESMARRARTKIQKNSWDITVVLLA